MTQGAIDFFGSSQAAATTWRERFGEKRRLVDDPSIREILGVASKKGILSFAGGFPDPSLLPLNELSTISREVMTSSAFTAAQYGVPEGNPVLREEISKVAVADQRPCDPSNIVITTGGQQAIDLLAQVFLDPGDVIAVTRPCYLGALQIFSGFKPRYQEISSDDEGPILEQVEAALRQGPKFFYLVSAFDNPSGVSVSRARAEAIMTLCETYDVPIIEDGAYKELYYDARHVSFREIEGDRLSKAGRSYDEAGRVIFVGTMSKIIAPGLRVGWIEAPREVVEGVTLLKQVTDLHSANMTQMVAAEFLKRYAHDFWKGLRSAYAVRRDAAVAAVEKHLASRVTRCAQPDGGFYLWIELDPSVDTGAMLARAVREHGVAYVPGAPFYATAPRRNAMRVCYSNLSTDGIDEGIARISRAIGAV